MSKNVKSNLFSTLCPKKYSCVCLPELNIIFDWQHLQQVQAPFPLLLQASEIRATRGPWLGHALSCPIHGRLQLYLSSELLPACRFLLGGLSCYLDPLASLLQPFLVRLLRTNVILVQVCHVLAGKLDGKHDT